MNKKLLAFSALVLSCFLGLGQNLSSLTFYRGDTLQGFDIGACQREAFRKQLHGYELVAFVKQHERKFMMTKYNLNPPVSRHPYAGVPTVLTAPCTNVDFSAGTFTGWTGAIGCNGNSTGPITVATPTITSSGINSPETSCSFHTLVNTSMLPQLDAYSGQPVVCPSGNTYSVRLGGEHVNVGANSNGGACNNPDPSGGNESGAEFIQESFVVTNSNALFTYKYSIVMDQITHTSGEQPYFRVQVLDSAGNPTNPCQQYYVEEDSLGDVPPGFLVSGSQDTQGNPVFYCPWTSNSISLTQYLGHSIIIRFTAAGCTLGGHFCYAYVDAACGSILSQITGSPKVCAGGTDTLTAPASSGGSTYQWQTLPSGTTGIVGPTNTQQVVVNQNGTYEVVITYAGGAHCSYALDTTITFTPLPVLNGTGAPSSCFGLHNGSASVNVTASTGPYSYSWSPPPGGGQGHDTATGLIPLTLYTVTVTSGHGCVSKDTIRVPEPPILKAIHTQDSTSCNGGNNGSGKAIPSGGTPAYAYSWVPSGGNGATAAGLSAGIYTCTVTDRNGCTTTTIDTIRQPNPLVVTNLATRTKCHGDSTGSDTVFVTGGSKTYSYLWSPNTGTTSKITGVPAGTYTVTVTDNHNCVSTSIALVKQPPLLVLASASRPTPCLGHTGDATITPSGGTGSYTYSWSPLPLVSSVDSTGGVAAGIYTVTVKDSNGCTQISSIAVSNTGGPKDTILHSHQVLCFGGTNGNATCLGSGGTGALTYSWSPSGTPTTPTDTTIINLPAGVYISTVTDASHCQTSVTDTIHQPTKVTATAVITNVNCFGQSTGSAVLTTSGGHPGYTYTWSPHGGNTSTGTAMPAGNYTCAIADTNGCPGTINLNITQPPLFATVDTTISTICYGQANGAALVTPTGGVQNYTYSWSGAGGNSPSATGLAAGTYTSTVTDAHGCTSITTAIVVQPAVVAPTNTTLGVACNGGTNGTATAVGVGGNAGIYSYSWSPSGGTSATTFALPAGTYTCTVTDAKGCVGTTVADIIQPALLVVNNIPKDITCNGLTNGKDSVTVTGGTSSYSYSWLPSGGTSSVASGLATNTYTCIVTDAHGCFQTTSIFISEPLALKDTISPLTLRCFGNTNGVDTAKVTGGTSSYSYSWSPGGATTAVINGLSAQTYTCTVTDAHGCVSTKTLVVNQPPQLVGTPSSTPAICLSDSGTASVFTTGGVPNYIYSWSTHFGTGVGINLLGPGTYTCTIFDANGCRIVVPVTVPQVNNSVHANFIASSYVGVAPDSIFFFDNSSPNANHWTWSFGDGNGTENAKNTFNVYTTGGIYTVSEVVTDNHGCDSLYERIITIKDRPSSLVVPNVFTPNGDGRNDFMDVKWEAIDSYDMKIYDRWGVLMAHIIHPWLGWDGLTFTGGKASDGTYYWVVAATGTDGKNYALDGFVQLIR